MKKQSRVHRLGTVHGGASRSPVGQRRLIHRGSLLLEAIVAIGIFALFLGGVGGALLAGQQTTTASGDRARATYLAEQELEAVRQMRAVNFSSVTIGQHGLRAEASGWSFSGSSVMENGYEKNITINSLGTDWYEVNANVSWNFGRSRSGSVLLQTYLTNWRKDAEVGNWAAMTRINNTSIGVSADLQKIAISGNYAYITSTIIGGGKGLYLYDITNPASPVRVAASFDLGVSAYGVVAIGDRLYLATGSDTQEVQVYDISSPTTLTTGNLLNSYDLPGSGEARSIAVYGLNVFVGTLDDPPNDQFYAIEMSETGPMTELGSKSVSGSVLGIALQDGYAYLASSYNIGEFQVLDVFDPTDLQFAPGAGIDMTDVYDGNAIVTSGTSALIGRFNGTPISELTLYDIGLSPVPSPPPGPWTLEIDGDVNSITTIPGSIYGFVAGSASAGQLRVFNLTTFSQGGSPVVKTYDAGGTMFGTVYDLLNDRLYGITSSNLMVFAPG